MHADDHLQGSLLAIARAVKAEERQPLALSFLYFFLVLGSYFVLRPIRDAMGIAGGTDDLPWLFLGTLILTLIVSPLFSTLVAKLPRRRFVAWSYRALIVCLIGFFVLLKSRPESEHVWIGRFFFWWVSVYNLFAVSLFWAVMADVWRDRPARRLYGVIAAGGTLGGLAGAAVTASLAETLGDVPLLLVSALMLELALRVMFALSRRAVGSGDTVQIEAERKPIGGSAFAAFSGVMRSPYLLGVCGYMLIFTLGNTVLYFLQADIVASAFSDRAERAAYFARVDVWVNALTLTVQVFLTAHVLGRLGVGLTLALLPLVSILGFSALAAAPVLILVVVFQVLRRTTDFALSRPARELLYVPLGREAKYKAKNLIDTFVYRAGDQIAAWSYTGLIALGLALGGIAALTAALSGLWFVLALWLGRRHAAISPSPAAAPDPAPRPATP
jgi:AAA family ATP:ADP antiporter